METLGVCRCSKRTLNKSSLSHAANPAISGLTLSEPSEVRVGPKK